MPATIAFAPTAAWWEPLTPTVLSVVLNEILPAPAAVDWDEDGAISAQDEWIELHNTAGDPVDLSGWALSDGTTRYSIPDGTVLEPGAFEVLYQGQTSRIASSEVCPQNPGQKYGVETGHWTDAKKDAL